MGTISGTAHIKSIFSLWTGVGKHFIVNALCSSGDSVTQLIHILTFFTINNFLYTSQEKNPEQSNLEKGGGGGRK
jgi:hypothetical protein